MTPRTIWLARHGNRQDFVNFEWRKTAERPEDPGLSTDGLIQAHELGIRLQRESIDHIFASPFLRTIETAHQVAEVLDQTIKLEAGLGEYIKPRGFHGQPKLLTPAELHDEFVRIDQGYCDRIHPQYPETWPDLRLRTCKTIHALTQDFPGNLLLVSHAASIKGLTLALNPRASRWDSPLCGITKLVHQNNHWNIELQREASHLRHKPNRIRDFLNYWRHRYWTDRPTAHQ